MRYCRNCGTAIGEQDRFCLACGLENPVAPQPQPQVQPQPDQTEQVLTTMYRMFKYERLAWKIGGIVYIAMAALWVLLSVLYLFIGFVSMFDDPEMGGMMLGFGGAFFIYVLLFASVGIYNLMMVKRADRYMQEMSVDIRPAITRATSVGMIVLGAMFNTIAMVFIIINFVNAKSNQAVLQQVAERQNP